jgi:aryl-alcohol dehydrogenase-like predicted oxidoreductase
LTAISRRLQRSEDAVALAAAIAQPWSDVVLSGAVTPGQISSNLGAVDFTLSPDELSELTSLSEQPELYWAARAALAWT